MLDKSTYQLASTSQKIDQWWTKPVGLATISAIITITLLTGAFIVGSNIDPSDDAEYIITAIAVSVAALNVLFTLLLLRTAQKQLILMRQQALEQQEGAYNQLNQLRESHNSERQEASQQLESLRAQLELARESHSAERVEATSSLKVSRDAVDAALIARLDQLAPRVSLAVTKTVLVLNRRANGQTEPTKDIGDPNSLEGLANFWLELAFHFELTNWGSEPVVVSFPSPWEGMEGGLLFPDNPMKPTHKFHINTLSLRHTAMYGHIRNETEPDWIFNVVVNDLGGQVTDYHRWRILPKPFTIDHGKIAHNQNWERRISRSGFRERFYTFQNES